MDYTITFYKNISVPKHGPSQLYAIWIDSTDATPQPGTVWEVVQTVNLTTDKPIPKALNGLLLMSEATSDKLFRDITDTWLGPTDDDPLNDYDRYASREESGGSLD